MLENEKSQPKKGVDKSLKTFCLTTPWFWYLFSLFMIIWDVVVLLFRVDKMMEDKTQEIIFPFMNIVYIICCILVILGFLMQYRCFNGKAHFLLLPLIIMFALQCLIYIISLVGMILTVAGAENVGQNIMKYVGIFRCNFKYYNESNDVADDGGFFDSLGDFFKSAYYIVNFVVQAVWNGYMAFILKRD